MENFEQKLIDELKTFRKAFKSTIAYHKYETNVFECLNKRYIAAGHLIDEYERRQKLQSENGKLPIPRVIKSVCDTDYDDFDTKDDLYAAGYDGDM